MYIICEMLYVEWHVKNLYINITVTTTTCGTGRATWVLYRRVNDYESNTGGN
jgi:hypothetical protein